MDYGTYASTRLPVLQKKSLCYFWYSLSTFKIMTVVKNLISRTHVGRAILDSPYLGRNKWDVLLCYNLQKEIYRFSDELHYFLKIVDSPFWVQSTHALIYLLHDK
jgi:hypothetical protein